MTVRVEFGGEAETDPLLLHVLQGCYLLRIDEKTAGDPWQSAGSFMRVMPEVDGHLACRDNDPAH